MNIISTLIKISVFNEGRYRKRQTTMSNDAVHDWIVPYLVGPVNADRVEGALRSLSEELMCRLRFAPPTVSKTGWGTLPVLCRWPMLSAPFVDEQVAAVMLKRAGAVRRGCRRLQSHRSILDILTLARPTDLDPDGDVIAQILRPGGFDTPERRMADAALVVEALREMGLASKSAPTSQVRKTRRGCRGGQSVRLCRQRRMTPGVEPSPRGICW